MVPRFIFLTDPEIRAAFGHGLDLDARGERGRKARRALRVRVCRAEARGVLPPRAYLSAKRSAWPADELLVALARLPRSLEGLAARKSVPPAPVPAPKPAQ